MILLVLGLCWLLAGVGVFGWQVYYWLNFGEWMSRSVLDFLRWAGPQNEWVQYPTRGIGIWKLLDWLPLSLTAILIGAPMLFVFASDRPPGPDPYARYWKYMLNSAPDQHDEQDGNQENDVG